MIARRVVSWSELALIVACGSSCGGRKADSDYHVLGDADASIGGAGSTTITTGNADTSLGGRGTATSGANASTRGGANHTFGAVGGSAMRTDSGIGGRTGSSNPSLASGGTAMTSTSQNPEDGCGLLLDDMEAQTGFLCEGNGRRGAWYAYNDEVEGSTIQWPERTTIPGTPIAVSESDRTTNGHAMRTYGISYSWAGIGFDLNFDGTTYRTFDASNYDGVTFWAKGSAFELRVGTVAPRS